jgi:ferredoxin-NADP reductase
VIGKFSEYLSKRLPGDKLISSEPFGYFYPDASDRDLVFVAGGVGVTPFLGMIREMKEKGFARSVTLFYSNKLPDTSLALRELKNLSLSEPKFNLVCNFTSSDYAGEDFKGRLDSNKIIKDLQTTSELEFYLCGSLGFTKDMYSGLVSKGFSPKRIFTEAFYSS